MNARRTNIARAVAAAVLSTALYATTGPAFAHPRDDAGRGPGPRAAQMSEADRAQMRERMQARMGEHLDRLAARLELKASQHGAWTQFRATVEPLFKDRPQRPARDADAATLMRFRADTAQHMARNLASVADATAQLQQALDPNQRKVLDEVARNMGQRGRPAGHHGNHHRGRHGDRHGGYGAGE